jgi:rhamnose utilization protein RhaD (predicted bifunctional aldolase and dehydrogenase)
MARDLRQQPQQAEGTIDGNDASGRGQPPPVGPRAMEERMNVLADPVAALAALSARIGADRRLVQGGGGNTSLKRDGVLWVKASGTWLAQAEQQPIFVPLPLAQVREALRTNDAEERLKRLHPEGGLRPSIETSLHALLPHAVVLHVHSVNAIARMVSPGGYEDIAARMQGLHWSWVPYRRPGYPLTAAVTEVLASSVAPPDVLILANHGLVVGGGDVGAAERLLQEVERRLALPARTPAPADRARLQAVNDLGWRIADHDVLHAVGTDALALSVARHGALYPDHVVFLGARAAVAEHGRPLSAAVADIAARGAATPVYAAVPGAGLLLAPTLSAGAEAMLECLALVGLRLARADGLSFLAAEDVAALTDWEAEAYRRARDRALPAA